jgi:lanosterol synthase
VGLRRSQKKRAEQPAEVTERRNWRLRVDEGRQVWEYVTDGSLQQTCEKYFLGLDVSNECPPLPRARTPLDCASNAVTFYSKIQAVDGHWANDYGGPMFLMPGLIVTCYISGTVLPEPHRREIIVYLSNIQARDGGWGLHIECPSNIFGTAMTYVAMRLLGLPREDERLQRARQFLLANGGARGIPTWGKFWLAALGCYEWSGLNAVPPELWLMPDWFPLHPGRWWCHCRVVYLPMGYVYGRRATGPLTPLVLQLREELYAEPYASIDWPSLRTCISPLDVYEPHSWLNRALFSLVNAYEGVHSSWLRQTALDMCIDHIRQEDANTKFIDIGPVNKCINMLAIFHADGPDSPAFKAHQARVADYLWISADGMKMQGYNGSQLWDTAFSVQAILETGLIAESKECLTLAYKYIDVSQVREDVPQNDKYYRHISKGAWPFSTRDHGWPISDCTSEGLKAALLLRQHCRWLPPLEIDRYFAAVNVILSMQNADGGWATYELKRGPDYLELINPAEVFRDIMVDYSYVECTSACVQALSSFRHAFPFHRADEVGQAVARGADFIRRVQKTDGSWLGKWAVCFTYGTWFGVEGLVAAGESPAQSEPLRKAREWLVSVQNANGSWGEGAHYFFFFCFC